MTRSHRMPLVAGNWKMYKTAGEGAILAREVDEEVAGAYSRVEIAVCPPFTALKSVSTLIELDKLDLKLGAQDCFWEEEGAFTGEVSPRMLVDLRCDYVIIGHSERREHFGETDETVNKKLRAVFAAGMTPIVCVGEPLEVKEAGGTEEFVRSQVLEGLAGLSEEEASRLVVAYEPIWAIGTGRTAVPESANDVARMIRATLGAMYGPPVARVVRVLYGGSVKPENAAMFFSEPDIDGGLIGGASLQAEPFARIVQAAL